MPGSSGAPPGYVGYEDGGKLTEAVRRRPYCLVLLDELEKAHPDVTGVLLQIMEEGVLTDSTGRRVSFRNAIVVMTSNVGSQVSGEGLGFSPSGRREKMEEALRECFAPEFLGRLDRIVCFRKLDEEALGSIAAKYLNQFLARCRSNGLTVLLPEETPQWLSEGSGGRWGPAAPPGGPGPGGGPLGGIFAPMPEEARPHPGAHPGKYPTILLIIKQLF